MVLIVEVGVSGTGASARVLVVEGMLVVEVLGVEEDINDRTSGASRGGGNEASGAICTGTRSICVISTT